MNDRLVAIEFQRRHAPTVGWRDGDPEAVIILTENYDWLISEVRRLREDVDYFRGAAQNFGADMDHLRALLDEAVGLLKVWGEFRLDPWGVDWPLDKKTRAFLDRVRVPETKEG